MLKTPSVVVMRTMFRVRNRHQATQDDPLLVVDQQAANQVVQRAQARANLSLQPVAGSQDESCRIVG